MYHYRSKLNHPTVREPTVMRLIALLVILVVIAGCSDDPTGPEPTPFVISGTVTGADGNPVANAAIVLDLAYEAVEKAAMPPATTIRIAMPAAGSAAISVLSACRADTFHHHVHDFESGVYIIPIDGTDAEGRQLTDQTLLVVIVTEHATGETPMALARNVEGEDGDYGDWDHAYVTEHVRIQATNDADGWFTLTDPCVGFGTTFTATNESGEPVGEYELAYRVRAWAYHADHAAGAASIWRDLDPETGGTVSVIMDD